MKHPGHTLQMEFAAGEPGKSLTVLLSYFLTVWKQTHSAYLFI